MDVIIPQCRRHRSSPDYGCIDQNMYSSDNFQNDSISNLNTVAWWTVNKTKNKF
jgi:hypothetical protein